MSVKFSTSKAAVFSQFGVPSEVVALGEVPVAALGSGEVLVGVEAAPINPADLNVLEGKYAALPKLPGVPGVEGVGRILGLGEGARDFGLGEGERVLLPHGFGSWRAFGVARAEGLVRVPEGVPLQQAAMLRINPATALCMLEEFVSLGRGDWILQNAANSGVGRSVIQIARAIGLRTVNVVRREGLEKELMGAGADVVLVEGENLVSRIREAVGGEPVKLGLNAVGGESALGLANALSENGKLVTYGAMGRQPLRLPNGLLIFKNISFHGFWVTRWYREASAERVAHLFRRLAEWAKAGVLYTPVEAEYPLERVREAVLHAERAGRSGKVMLLPGI